MYYFVVNPHSRSGKGLAIWKEVEAYLKEQDIEYEACLSKRPGHVEDIVHDISKEHLNDETPINIVVVGGDGTLDESLQGILDFGKVNLGYIPIGSSNDFARALKYPNDSIAVLQQILTCREPKILDLGKLKYIETSDTKTKLFRGAMPEVRYFDAGCGIGFDAAVCAETFDAGNSKSFLNKIGLGKLTYITICLKQLSGSEVCNAKLILDGDETIDIPNLRLVVGMNTAYEGGGLKFCPGADPSDGLLDICTANNVSTGKILTVLPLIPKGKHIKNKNIHMYRAKSYEVITDRPMWVHTDGESYTKATHIKVSCLPGRLRLLF